MKKNTNVFILKLLMGSLSILGALEAANAAASAASQSGPVKCSYAVYKVDLDKPYGSEGSFEVISPEQELQGYSTSETDLFRHEFGGNSLSLFFTSGSMTMTLNQTSSIVAINNSIKTPILSLFVTSQSDPKIQYSITCKK